MRSRAVTRPPRAAHQALHGACQPRRARVVALNKTNDRENASQCTFQRYIEPCRHPVKLVLFDRSWYNRAGVERVIGVFPRRTEYLEFSVKRPR